VNRRPGVRRIKVLRENVRPWLGATDRMKTQSFQIDVRQVPVLATGSPLYIMDIGHFIYLLSLIIFYHKNFFMATERRLWYFSTAGV